jgi:hypothetical protein
MKRVEAKIVGNVKENPTSEPDEDPNTWLIEAKLEEDVFEWENVQLDFRGSEIKAEIVETAMTEPTRCTVRTRGQSPLKKGDPIHVDIREQKELEKTSLSIPCPQALSDLHIPILLPEVAKKA